MPNPRPPKVPGTDFYTLEIFRGDRLEWVITQHIAEYIHTEPEQIGPFFGEYILSDNDGTLLDPQCCGDLSDVMWWKHLCYRKESVYYNGHPCPRRLSLWTASTRIQVIKSDSKQMKWKGGVTHSGRTERMLLIL